MSNAKKNMFVIMEKVFAHPVHSHTVTAVHVPPNA